MADTIHIHETALELFSVSIANVMDNSFADIEQVNWKVQRHEFWAVGGFSSNVKSAFLPTIASLQKPESGMVLSFGQNLFDLTDRELVEARRRIGTIFPRGGRMFNDMTVLENISLPIRYHHNLDLEETLQIAGEIVEKTGLKTFAQKSPGTLNQSWQERVSLARAIALKPDILLIDRPLAWLEFRHWKWWFHFLKRMVSGEVWNSEHRCTVVVTTDDLQPWAEHATHFARVENKSWKVLSGSGEISALQPAESDEISPDDLLAGY
jgi:ABC-type transporter Mla maintaining outer membrane lipid asymmetry ATPase subunit MlaF